MVVTPTEGSRAPAPGPRTRAWEQVLDRVESDLAAGRLHVGDRLPPERELASDLGISRPAVREALRVMEAWGTVASGTGSGPDAGTVLIAAPAAALTRFLRLHVLLASIGSSDVVRARVALERESTRLAARHATPDDLAAIAVHLDAMDDPALDAAGFNDHDTAFHVAIAHATGNPLVAELTIALREAMRPRLLSALRDADDLPSVTAQLRLDHHGIHDAIRRGRPEVAADLVEAHITQFYGAPD
jgi:GntR family transcriptional regulator, transcriptional repressor for pyruvate dehydrogenase complex